MKSINPMNGHVIQSYPVMTETEVHSIIKKSHNIFLNWRKISFKVRADCMKKAAILLRNRKERYATLMTQEMGKVYKESLAEIEKCAWVCEYYAEHAASFLQDETIQTNAAESFITYQPIGAVLAVMPWNFPFWQVFRFAAPALMAGNVGLLKHASNVSGTALAIEEVFKDAGFPDYAFSTLLIPSSAVAGVIEHPYVRAVTLTGSTGAGKAVAAKAGECLKKTVLELGGSDPYIILEDANLAHAAKCCVTSRMINAGQSCIAAKRFIVLEAVYDDFLRILTEEMQQIIHGDPMDEHTSIGPQASHALRDELHNQVQQSIDAGAVCILGGFIPEHDGAFYPATLLTNVQKGMPAYDQELFGPVASVIKVNDEKEAIMVANDTSFGLGGAVFTENTERGMRIAREEIDAGACFINDFITSDPRAPFGGVKESGYGRELSYYGIREFMNIKSILQGSG